MDSFNKVASFILGLVVVVVFIAIISGRINLGKRISFLSQKPTPTPTITPTPIKSPTITISGQNTTTTTNTYHSYTQPGTSTTTPSTIPSTGPETILLPTLFSLAGAGYFLRKSKKS